MMKVTRLRSRNRFLMATAIAAAAAAVAALATPALASTSTTTATGPGYPPPAGIYKPFTNCPLNNPYMHETIDAMACVAGNATSGSITIGNITTPVTEAVHVQFGFGFTPSDDNYPAPAFPPLAGPSALLNTKPDLIPGTLTDALGCATATDAAIEQICQTAETKGGAYNQVTALAQEAGELRDFNLFDWVQPVKFKLINPLLGSTCYIGSDSDPVVLHPSLSVGPGGGLFVELDPQPTVHPDTGVLGINGAVAQATGFDAPGVLGCGPGGVANVAVDEALNAWAGLPTTGAASAGNSLTLNGSFLLGASTAGSDSTLPQPQDQASNLLAAFQASTNGEHSIKRKIGMKGFKSRLHYGG